MIPNYEWDIYDRFRAYLFGVKTTLLSPNPTELHLVKKSDGELPLIWSVRNSAIYTSEDSTHAR